MKMMVWTLFGSKKKLLQGWLSAEASGNRADRSDNVLALLNPAHAQSVHSHSSAAQRGTGMFSLIT